MNNKQTITVKTILNAPTEKVWRIWTEPEHIKRWNTASDDWHTTIAENDLKVGGNFLSRMEAKDGSFGFDFAGTYEDIKLYERIVYSLGDNRKVAITFVKVDNQTEVIETFDAEETNPIQMQQAGWQAILDNFKKYAEETIL